MTHRAVSASSTPVTRLWVGKLTHRAVAGTASSTPVTTFLTAFAFRLSMLMAPINKLFEMLSRWPRYLSQGPAMLMWSVVHFPLACEGKGTASPVQQTRSEKRVERRPTMWSQQSCCDTASLVIHTASTSNQTAHSAAIYAIVEYSVCLCSGQNCTRNLYCCKCAHCKTPVW